MSVTIRFTIIIAALLGLVTPQLFAKEIDREKAIKAATTFLKIEKMRECKRIERLAKKGVEIAGDLQKYKIKSSTPISDENTDVLAYITELEPEGYIVTSADDRINPIIAYSYKGKFPYQDSKQNVLLHLIKYDMQERKTCLDNKPEQSRLISTKNNEKWADYLSGGTTAIQTMALAEAAATQTQWPDPSYGSDGWIKTNWDQGEPFNNKCPDNTANGEKCAVGCVATASSQIINFWKYPTKIYFDPTWLFGDDYTSKGDLNGDGQKANWEEIDIDGGSGLLNFPTFEDLNTQLSEIDYSDTEDISSLCFGFGIKVGMDYGEQSGASTYKVAKALRQDFSYGSACEKHKTNGVWDNELKQKVINNIKLNYPVQIGVRGPRGGHSIIIDGYRSSDDMFHLNLGWADIAGTNTWYDLPSFDADGIEFNILHTVVYDILPYFGWHQYGGNQENNFRTIYSAPSEEPIREKWKGSIHPNCKGMIVGSGNNIYLTKNPLIINDSSYHPSILIINQYGEKIGETVIAETSSTISHPVQSQDGNIYFGAGDAVYRFRPDKKTYSRVFQDTGNSFYGDSKPRIDQEGRMYFGSTTTVVCLSSTGFQLWSSRWICPSGGVMHTGIPSIDVARNNVYISYWKSATQTAHLVCINRLTGTTRYEKSFTDIPSGDRGIYTPAIGSDGTIYTSVRTKIYALTPGTSSFSEKWVQDKLYARYQPIALGPDDTVYTEYWTMSGGNYFVTFAALNPANGTVKWQSQGKPDVGSYTNFGQPYCAGNGIVIFPVKWDTNPNRYELFAYRDNGSSGQELWNYSTNHDQNAQLAMGPGATIYLYQTNLITALSNGSVGDPDGGGMCYLDNVRPNVPQVVSPADGAIGLASTVNLSWSATDPEGQSIKYSLFVGESGYDMVPVATDLTVTSYQLTDLEPGTSYRWMIVATDGQAVSDGPTWVFTTEVSADIDRNGKINLQDYAKLGQKWQVTGCNYLNNWCAKADIDKSGIVEFKDLLLMAEQWLKDTNNTTAIMWVTVNDQGVPGHEGFNGQMSKYLITNAQYCEFLNRVIAANQIIVHTDNMVYATTDTGYSQPYFSTEAASSYSQISYSGGVFSVRSRDGYDMSNHPVVCVSWYGANGFCNFYGYRLPTEWEWQAAADFDGTYTYGCGTSIDPSKANYGSNNPLGLTDYPYTTPVDYYPAYGYGMCDMAGNAWVWTSSTYDDYFRVIRGSRWDFNGESCTVAYWGYGSPNCTYDGHTEYFASISFRVCR